MQRKVRSGFVGRWIPVALLAAVTASIGPGAVADEDSPVLAGYRKRIDDAVDKGLKFLVSQQQEDGSFKSPGMPGNTAVTSLSVMAFLAKGYTPEIGPYSEVIDKGIDYIVARQQADGLLVAPTGQSSGPMYEHCISTLMLSEVSGMVGKDRQEKIDTALSKALKLIITAQQVVKPATHQGGWRYQSTSGDSDISVTGWGLMALRSARNAGAAVPKASVDQAVQFVMNCRNGDGGFGYQPGGQSGLARTGTSLLCLELCGKHGDAATAAAGKWILAHPVGAFGDAGFHGGHFYYGMYYCSQGMFQLGGAAWETFAKNMYEIMLKAQQDDGSWPSNVDSGASAGPCYSTAMSLLAMSVIYRQLPIYQR